jgi:peptidyl-tRNA hydrolase
MELDEDIRALLDERKRTMAEFTADHRPLKLYAIYRQDLEMPPGKLAAQCGHAYLNAYEKALELRPEITRLYKGTGNGTKICAYQKNLGQLLRTYREIRDAGLPCDLIIDRGHVLSPCFDGNPIITAIGIGPCYPEEIEKQLKRCTLAK